MSESVLNLHVCDKLFERNLYFDKILFSFEISISKSVKSSVLLIYQQRKSHPRISHAYSLSDLLMNVAEQSRPTTVKVKKNYCL